MSKSRVLRTSTLLVIKIFRKLFYNTPIHRLKLVNVIYEKLFHAAFNRTEMIPVHYEGAEFLVPARDITILPSLLNNCYEKEEIRFLKEHLKPGSTFVDVGANIGLFSVLAGKVVGNMGKVYSFEPEPTNFKLLQKNSALNNLTNITSENVALGRVAGVLKLYIENNSIGTHSLLKKKGNVEHTIDVKVVSLDGYFKNNTAKIHMMKIDVEGFEPYVLEGAKELLRRTDCLLFEYNREDYDKYGIDKFINLINDFGYLYGINERRHNISIFSISDFKTTSYINIVASKKPLI